MFNLLLSEVLRELTEDIQKDPSLKTLSECQDESDLHSVLRDRLFRTDARTREFLDKLKHRFASPEKIAAQELTESEFGQLLCDSLEKAAKTKNSKLEVLHHYFSPEHDLIVKVKAGDKKEARFRVLVVKTS